MRWVASSERGDQSNALSPTLSLPAPKTGLPEPTAAKSLDRGSDWTSMTCEEKR
jgi:hypothetical protein